MLFMHRGAFKSPKEIIETKSGMEQTKEIVDECNDSFMYARDTLDFKTGEIESSRNSGETNDENDKFTFSRPKSNAINVGEDEEREEKMVFSP